MLVADRLSALMLVLVGVVSLGAAAVRGGRAGARAGVYFHPLFQIQLMGLNGAFLTGDLFNLFVFFEVMLAASYGLQLHGSGWPRVRSGLHYIAVNLLASSLFLVGLAMLYGVMGTLSMADIADEARRSSRRAIAGCCTPARPSSPWRSSSRRRSGRSTPGSCRPTRPRARRSRRCSRS